jgi:uncharacterized protein YecE (DUF72 family)
MTQLRLFDDDRPLQSARLAPKLQKLAAQRIYFGTSSWKYDGWLGSIYTAERYSVGGKISQRKFESECLAEYAETFPVVGGDFSFYQFPSRDYWHRLFRSAPRSLLFGFKVPEAITVAAWPHHARYGDRRGQKNPSFLDSALFEASFARELLPYSERVAALIFEFGTFSKSTFGTHVEFTERLDTFLRALNGGFRYAVEIRNPEYLRPDYFGMLAGHNVSHVFNAWTRMPDLSAQSLLSGAFTADFTVTRALLTRGRTYEDAVRQFAPYRDTQAPDSASRDGLRSIAQRSSGLGRPAFLFVNNRLEGNAPSTIEAVVSTLVDS